MVPFGMGRMRVVAHVAACCLVACGAFGSDAEPAPTPPAAADTDAGPPGTMSAADGGGDSSIAPVGAPPGCDPTSPPQTSPACVVDEFGIFVDPSAGVDGQAGTKAAPVKTVAAAISKLAGRQRIYLCDGVLDEHVKLTAAVDLYGGFTCDKWSYTGTKTRVAPHDVGPALEIRGVATALQIVDMDFTGVAGTDASSSSVAALVKASPNVTLRRVALSAKDGFVRSVGTAGLTGTNGGGVGMLCTCSSGGMSTGGTGGAKGGNGAPSNPGNPGAPAQAVPTPTGADGSGAASGSVGIRGSDANGVAAVGAGAGHPFDLVGEALVAASGNDGSNGAVAQGGGGSASTVGISAATPSLPGRGGGCGGCGGFKGIGGAGGGASIALLAFDAPVQLDTCVLTAGSGGRGQDGGDGGPGGLGGPGQAGDLAQSSSKAGGKGGTGGSGGGAGGGAGGVAAGVVYQGAKVVVAPTTMIATGAFGAKGLGGAPGGGNGVDGVKSDVLALP